MNWIVVVGCYAVPIALEQIKRPDFIGRFSFTKVSFAIANSLEQSHIDHLGNDDGGDGLGAAEDIDERIRAKLLVEDFRR